MSASFSLASADITEVIEGEAGRRLEGVQITVRSGKATISTDRGAPVEDWPQRTNVILSRRVNRLKWEVTFADHTVWTVDRSKKGCRTCS